jgi:hypothetical protein
MWANVFELAGERFAEFSDTISFTHRLTSPGAALSDMSTHPLSLLVGYGVGAENYFFLSGIGLVLTGNPVEDAAILRTFDNTFVTVMYSFGVLGLGWLILTIVKAFRRVDLLKSDQEWYFGALAASICAICFFNAFGSPLANFLIATLLGLGTAVSPRKNRTLQPIRTVMRG